MPFGNKYIHFMTLNNNFVFEIYIKCDTITVKSNRQNQPKIPQGGIIMNEILKLLEQNSRYTARQLAPMLDMEEAAVEAAIAKYEADKVILGYQALVDWDRAGEEFVTALIEVKVTPQLGDGFDRIAERIYQYEEVESVYLMSGAFDLTVIISGKSLKEVAQFVARRLSTIEGVTSTATHFILKKYKEKHCLFQKQEEQKERTLFV